MRRGPDIMSIYTDIYIVMLSYLTSLLKISCERLSENRETVAHFNFRSAASKNPEGLEREETSRNGETNGGGGVPLFWSRRLLSSEVISSVKFFEGTSNRAKEKAKRLIEGGKSDSASQMIPDSPCPR